MAFRKKPITDAQLRVALAEYASHNKETIGYGKGQIEIKTLDARLKPYTYRLVRYRERGGYDPITRPMTKRELHEFLEG